MFERYTERAIKSVMLAQEEARRMAVNYLAPEHMFLGIIGEKFSKGAKLLSGIKLEYAREVVGEILGRGEGFVAVEIPFTDDQKRINEYGWKRARDFGQNFIGTEHLLLALLEDESPNKLRQVLKEMGIDREMLIAQTIKAIQRPPQDSDTKVAAREVAKFDNPYASLPMPGEEWEHFKIDPETSKGKRYVIESISESQIVGMEGVPLVNYRALYGARKLHTRTLTNFVEIVPGRGPAGDDVQRFKRVR